MNCNDFHQSTDPLPTEGKVICILGPNKLQNSLSRRFFMANGCSIDTWVYPDIVRALVAAARVGHKKSD